MSTIREVEFELLRAGPAHNQLLSTLTPYIALCGPNGPSTVHVPFEHQRLLTRLERLRYGAPTEPIPASQRQAELREIGEEVGKLFASVPSLLTELSQAGDERSSLLNLRLSITAYELGLIPFETAISPDGIPGAGTRLQLRSLVTITREVRRGKPLPVDWKRKPKILFAYASPAGLAPVPALDHLKALRRAIDPWVAITDDDAARKTSVQGLLTVLPDASLEKLRDACRTADYTHVHLLAHGATFRDAGNDRYGVALFNESGDGGHAVVDGERLAIALMGRDASGRCKPPPTVVTLATCDSGNVSTVLVPGGSIAHELHTHGIPWVIASQFPLWMRASTLATEVLYAGMLGGDDPRWVLHHLRQRLRADLPDTHDWASIVAYASIPADLQAQVHTFRDKQVRQRLEVRFDRIDNLVGANRADSTTPAQPLTNEAKAELQAQCDAIRRELSVWIDELTPAHTAKQRAERHGVRGASEKRIAIAFALAGEHKDSSNAYINALAAYQEAHRAESLNPWVLTQLLAMAVVPQLDPDGTAAATRYRAWWVTARQLAQWQLQYAEGIDRIWAQGTLAELELLGAVYQGAQFDADAARDTVVELCRNICATTPADGFPRLSTLRQFRRYARYWQRDGWDKVVTKAIAALEDETGRSA